jgi:hypothetical protein
MRGIEHAPLLSVEEEASVTTHITDCYQRGYPISPRQVRTDALKTMPKC